MADRPDNLLIELYRANIADPDDFQALKTWLNNELVRIQATSVSIEEVLANLQEQIDTVESEPGPQGPPGPAGSPGEDGKDGDDGECECDDLDFDDIFRDGEIRNDRGWSSYKINQELTPLGRRYLGIGRGDGRVPDTAGNVDQVLHADGEWRQTYKRIDGGDSDLTFNWLTDVEIDGGDSFP